MTIEEAIAHAREVAKNKRETVKIDEIFDFRNSNERDFERWDTIAKQIRL